MAAPGSVTVWLLVFVDFNVTIRVLPRVPKPKTPIPQQLQCASRAPVFFTLFEFCQESPPPKLQTPSSCSARLEPLFIYYYLHYAVCVEPLVCRRCRVICGTCVTLATSHTTSSCCSKAEKDAQVWARLGSETGLGGAFPILRKHRSSDHPYSSRVPQCFRIASKLVLKATTLSRTTAPTDTNLRHRTSHPPPLPITFHSNAYASPPFCWPFQK